MAREVIRVRNEFYIRSSSARVDVRTRVLKQGDTFAVFDRLGDIETLAVDVSFAIEFDADFADIFELRGMNRERRGRRLQSQVRKDGLVLGYEGLDNRIRRTRIAFDPPPTRLSESVATFQIRLEAGKDASFRCAIACEVDGDSSNSITLQYETAVEEAARALQRVRAREPQIFTGNEQFNDWLNRSLAYLHMMRTETPYGLSIRRCSVV